MMTPSHASGLLHLDGLNENDRLGQQHHKLVMSQMRDGHPIVRQELPYSRQDSIISADAIDLTGKHDAVSAKNIGLYRVHQ